ncbi:MAG: hypothetical protein F6J92_39565 [Symploca sp. SIO1A3]|nr:hypothetical protein [Symploca sp. SIO2C1]NER52638.1 hypothetical protein [Symploca sp. SIO1A3]
MHKSSARYGQGWQPLSIEEAPPQTLTPKEWLNGKVSWVKLATHQNPLTRVVE